MYRDLDSGLQLGSSIHIASHEALLEPSGTELEPRAPDAIIVPTVRPHSLRAAAALADALRCQLVVLCSTPGQAEHALSACAPVQDLLVTFAPAAIDDNLLSFRTSVFPANRLGCSSDVDIARKRNVGLLLARLCGWNTIMYLDDDIMSLTPEAVSRAAGMTARFMAVGFAIGHYPDNSVVCHAYRLAGGEQGRFPGGSALLIDVTRCQAMFPPIYNEDWLFLIDAISNRSFAAAGTLSQIEYYPFASPSRAASEEFGDLIAEGLFRLMHEGGTVVDATRGYWRDALEGRLQLINHIGYRLLSRTDGKPATRHALISLSAARGRLAATSPSACASFIGAWRADLDAWRDRLSSLPAVGDLADAAKFLDLQIPKGLVANRLDAR